MEQQQFLNIPVSTLSFFLGLVDGDGTITIYTKTKTVYIVLCINLEIADAGILFSLKEKLGFGRVVVITKIKMVRYYVKMSDLSKILFPLMLHHSLFFLINSRRQQF